MLTEPQVDMGRSALPPNFKLSKDNFLSLLPKRPYCTNDMSLGVRILPAKLAGQYSHIQLNGPKMLRWMIFDLDYRGAYLIHRDVDVPQPNIVMVRKGSGHLHAAYLLENAVAKHCAARVKPLKFFAAVERGLARRTHADRHYRGLIAKNPLHSMWDVEWRQSRPYSLLELADWLSKEDMRPSVELGETFGWGRNCELFDQLRKWAYTSVLAVKRQGASSEAWRLRCLAVALNINQQFPIRLGPSEVGATSKSVANWTWKRFGDSEFSKIQSARGVRGAAKRWDGHVPARDAALAAGVSLSTYFRQKRERSSRSIDKLK